MIPGELRRVPLAYVVRIHPSGPIKIGMSCHLERRFDALQQALPYELRLLAVLVFESRQKAETWEMDAHRRFGRFRMRGEWYRADRELLTILAATPNMRLFSGRMDERRQRHRRRPDLTSFNDPTKLLVYEEALLHSAEVCRILNVSKTGLRRLIADGQLRPISITSRSHPRFRPGDVRAYLARSLTPDA